jgi:hypothetical protein
MGAVMQATAHAATDKAARYMTQLAKHWGHKFEVDLDDRQARIVLPIGVCRMTAYPDQLEVTAEAADAATLTRLETVVAEHLGRFAFREPELTLAWVRQA